MTATTVLADGGEQAAQDWAQLAALVMADEFSSYDLNVRSPGWDGSQLLQVTNVPGMLCDVSVAADGRMEWERRLSEGRQADPACTATEVLRILGADTAGMAVIPAPGCRCAVSFKGATGRILVGHGVDVKVRVYPDQEFFEVYSDIEVTNPKRPERGTVCVADDGSLRWRCRARTVPGDEEALDPAQVAGIIARAVTATDHPGARSPHGHALSNDRVASAAAS